MLLLTLLACRPLLAPDPLLLAAQVSLSLDHARGRAVLTISPLVPGPHALPAERNGVPPESCRTLVPVLATDSREVVGARVAASCGDETLTLTGQGPYRHVFDAIPPVGTECTVSIDGSSFVLPPTPAVPALELRRGQLSWTPGGGDELRVSVPRSEGRSTLCRYDDDGEGPAPRGMGRELAFFGRHRHGLAQLPQGRVAITVNAGSWWQP